MCPANSHPPAPTIVLPGYALADNHYRYLMRLMTARTTLYTEMVVESTINHTKDISRFVSIAGNQHPVAIQLGGNDPEKLARAAKIVEEYGYDEINLNVGCPSSRVAVSGGRRVPGLCVCMCCVCFRV